MILFGFEVDVLEIALREQLEMIDHVFIVEATVTHKGIPKPLMWERLKFTERFRFVNKSKVSHVVVDDQMKSKRAREEEWYAENVQTEEGIKKVREWAISSNQELDSDDLFISGNVDEVLSREALQQLSWCESPHKVITGALWMPMGRLDQALRPGALFSLEGRPHAWANPTIYRWKDIAERTHVGKRFGPSFENDWTTNYVLGGIHMTRANYLPNAILKQVSASEGLWYPGSINKGFLLTASKELFDEEQRKFYNLDQARCWREMMDPLPEARDVDHYIPAGLACNVQRFPHWFGLPDPRNADMAILLAQVRREMISMGLHVPKPANGLFPTFLEPPSDDTDTDCQMVLSVMET